MILLVVETGKQVGRPEEQWRKDLSKQPIPTEREMCLHQKPHAWRQKFD